MTVFVYPGCNCVTLHRGSSLKPAHPASWWGKNHPDHPPRRPKYAPNPSQHLCCPAALLTRLAFLPSVIPRTPESGRSQASIRPKSHIEGRGRVIPNSLPIQNLINGQLFKPRRIKPHPCILWLPGQAVVSIEIPSQTPPDTHAAPPPYSPYSPRATPQQ